MLLGGRRNDLGATLCFASRSFRFHSGRGDGLAPLGEAADFFAQFPERQRHGLAPFGFCRSTIGSGLDRRRDQRHLFLYLSSETLGIERAFFGGFGQSANFIGDHRKTAAVIAGPGRLDRGIERQKVGLVRNLTDGLGDVTDTRGLSA